MKLGERFCVAALLQKTSRVIILDCKFGEIEYSGNIGAPLHKIFLQKQGRRRKRRGVGGR
jgi:hypothetical protein